MLAKSWYWHPIVLALVLCSEAFSQQGIPWQTDLQTAKQQAGAANQLVLVHFWAPWCAACRKMDQDVYVDPAVIAAVRGNYVPVRLNVDHNPGVARGLGVTALPTDVVITPEGKVLETYTGFTGAGEYAGRLNRIAVIPRRQAMASQQPGPTSPAAVGSPAPPAMTSPAMTTPANQPPAPPQFTDRRPANIPGPSWNMPGNTAGNTMPSPGEPAGVRPPHFQPTASPANASEPPKFASPPPIPSWSQQATQAPPLASQTPAMASQAPPTSPNNLAGPDLAAGQPPTGAPPIQPAIEMPLALDGYCPVELVDNKQWTVGDRRWGATHEGRTYLFTGPEQQQRFLGEPDRYSPVNSGNDVVLAMEDGQAVSGRREHGVFYGSRIYLFSSEDSLQAFSRQPGQYESALARASQAASRAKNFR